MSHISSSCHWVFSCCPLFSVPHQQWELKKEETGEKNAQGKTHNFCCGETWLIWHLQAEHGVSAAAAVCPCIFLLFSFPVGVFLLFLVQQTSMWFFYLFSVCSPVCSNCYRVSLVLGSCFFCLNLIVPKKWIIKEKKQIPWLFPSR